MGNLVKKGIFTASRYLASGKWESAEFDDSKDAQRFVQDYPIQSISFNVAIPASALLAAINGDSGS